MATLDDQTSPTRRAVLVLNCGSSSLKLAVLDAETLEVRLSGLAQRLDTPEAVLELHRGAGDERRRPDDPSLAAVLELVLGMLRDERALEIVGGGHRVVHGGERLTRSVEVDDRVLDEIRACTHLAPLHNPANLLGLEQARATFPDVPHVAVFDTAFHASMPSHAYRYAVPESWYRGHGVRRYGFHGTSHRYVSARGAELLGRPAAGLRLVTAHLGNGCSAAAVRDGACVDTTMGMTPLEGLVMGTRSGDLDPGVVAYMAERLDVDAEAVTRVLNRESGLLGLSGVGNDMREIEAAAEAGHEGALLALDVFVYRLARHVAALVVPLERLDALVFTGGIGEHSVRVRRLVLARLAWLGLEEDPAANALDGRETGGRITTPGPVQALVVPTDEERLIAQDTMAVVRGREEGG